MWLQVFLCPTTTGLSSDGNAEEKCQRKILQPQLWRGILKLRAKMKLCLLLEDFIAVCYELRASSGLGNREAALTSVNKAPKRSVRGSCRIIQGYRNSPIIYHIVELHPNIGQNDWALENLKKAETMYHEMGIYYWLN
jgi:hypothetical protein